MWSPAPASELRALHSDFPSHVPHEQDPCCSLPDQLPEVLEGGEEGGEGGEWEEGGREGGRGSGRIGGGREGD